MLPKGGLHLLRVGGAPGPLRFLLWTAVSVLTSNQVVTRQEFTCTLKKIHFAICSSITTQKLKTTIILKSYQAFFIQ